MLDLVIKIRTSTVSACDHCDETLTFFKSRYQQSILFHPVPEENAASTSIDFQ